MCFFVTHCTCNLPSFRYIVDNVWTHDKDLPAIRTEQGHYNNQVRIKPGPTGYMLIKNPREGNLISAVSKKAKADVHTRPKSAGSNRTSQNYQLNKCLSGDDNTLILSQGDDFGVTSLNDTLVNSAATVKDEQDASDDEIDDAVLPLEEDVDFSKGFSC